MPASGVDQRRQRQAVEPFAGFEPITGNFIYCPNQFFDVCLPNYSRGVVRLVAFMLRKTLGWLDKDGNPIEQNISVSYGDLIAKAGVSRGAARQAIDDAIAGGFIRRTKQGRASSRGVTAQHASFELCWDTAGDYVKDVTTFQGFYAGEGHRTPIPNAFFDHIVPGETLAVTKVVGAVLRHTVGYQNQFGGRRSQAPLSYSYIQKYTHLLHRPTVAEALHDAIARGYVRCVSPGCFDPRGGKRSRAAHYAVNWLERATSRPGSSNTEPGVEQSKNSTGGGSESEPADQFKNRTDTKTRPNNTFKQQQSGAVVEKDSQTIRMLREAGFDEPTAKRLAQANSPEDIKQQIDWLDKRNPQQNPLGMLRRAIEEKWAAPHAVQQHQKQKLARERERQREAEQAAEEERRQAQEQRRRERWFALSVKQRADLRQAAIDKAHPRMRPWLEKQPADRPVSNFLSEMENSLDNEL